ncbi:hypothetical protein LINGRAHAP2_LOCUS19109 [Linum grandiflorum]
MALPSVLATGSHMDLLRKSEKEDDGHMPSAVSDREAEKINPPKRRNVIRIQLRKEPVGKTTTATASPPKLAQETEKKPREGGKLTGVQKVRDLDSSNFNKPPTSTSVVRKAVTVTAAPKRKLEEDEYEKKLENSTRKMREGYNQYTDSRKRSKITHYIPPKSNHDQLPNQKKSKLLTTTRRR